MKYVDLHIHSNFSDGRYTPHQIVDEAFRNDVGIMSITDHDTLDAYDFIDLNKINQLKIINGIEISSFLNSKKNGKTYIHILGYDLDRKDKSLISLLTNMKDYRTEINKKYVEQVLELFKFIPSSIKTDVDNTKYYRIGWEIVKYLQTLELSEEQVLEVKRYCRKNNPKYPEYDISADRVIETIKNANGISVVAHPYGYNLDDLEIKRMIKKLIEYGIEGIETYHCECTLENMKKLRMLTESYKLLYSCGSDFHFPTIEGNKIIGHGINDNLCIEESTLVAKVLSRKKERMLL